MSLLHKTEINVETFYNITPNFMIQRKPLAIFGSSLLFYTYSDEQDCFQVQVLPLISWTLVKLFSFSKHLSLHLKISISFKE